MEDPKKRAVPGADRQLAANNGEIKTMKPVRISYFSDVLCVWAYAARRRVEELADNFSDKITIESHYCSVFPDAHTKISENWKSRDGFEGFNHHINEVAERFPHIQVTKHLWLEAKPRTSITAHIFLKAIALIEEEDRAAAKSAPTTFFNNLSSRADWAVRKSFFANGEDISDWQVLSAIANNLNIDSKRLMEKVQTSQAVAAFAADLDFAHTNAVTVSPTYLMNDGRQKMTGNVGYRVLEANVDELLRAPSATQASWC